MTSPAESRRALWPLLLGLAVLLGAAFPYFERVMNANERPRLLQGMAWVDAGESAIDGDATRGIPAGIDTARGVDGRLLPNKPPGATVPAAVAYRVVKLAPGAPTLRGYTWVARMLGAWLPTLVLLAFAWRRFTPRFGWPATAFALVTYALATPVTSYARVLFGHQLAACLLFIGVLTTWDAIQAGRVSRAALGGAVASAAVVVEYFAAFAGIPLAVVVAMALRNPTSRPAAAAAVGGAVLPVAALGAYHAAAFGSVFSTPYHHVVRDEFAAAHATGLLGLSWPTATSVFEHLVSPWGGLLLWAPLSIFAVWALASKTSRAEDRLCLATFVVVAALSLGLTQTGGWRVGPRYVVCALPFCMPGFAVLLSELKARAMYAVVVGLGIVSVVVNAMAGSLFPHLIPEGNPVRDLLVPLLAEGLEPYNPLQAVGLYGVAVPLLVVGAALLFVRASRPQRRVDVALALGVAMAAAACLATIPAGPTADASLAAVSKVWQPRDGEEAPRSPAL